MRGRDRPADVPAAADLAPVFDVYEVRTADDAVVYVGEPMVEPAAVEQQLHSLFAEHGYEIRLSQGAQRAPGLPLTAAEYTLVARRRDESAEGIPWRNVALFVATVLSTLFAGAYFWYQIPVFQAPLRSLEAWPFTLAIMGVLGIHELGHWAMSRYHGVEASLPYFIPLPTYIGSMGAVIRMRGRIPDRRALFDIGAAGPLAGLVATAVVTVIGLQLEPLAVQSAAPATDDAARIVFHNPPLLELLATASGAGARLESGAVHPVVFGGWVGMFVTFLNLLPVGQLDGGHILRAVLGERQRTVAALVPAALFTLAGYLLFVVEGANSVGIWAMWGIFALGLAYAGPTTPIHEQPLDRWRLAVALLTFGLGALCFTPIPVEIVTP